MSLLALFAAAAVSAAPSPPPAVYYSPIWLARPQGADFAAAYPESADGAGGGAMLECTTMADGGLTDCAVKLLPGSGAMFADAALSLAPKYRHTAYDGQGRPTAGRRIVEQVMWTYRTGNRSTDGSPMLRLDPRLPRPSIVMAPPKMVPPTWEQMVALYPGPALKAGVAGRVLLECKVEAGVGPRECVVLSETPAGFGFGAASVELAKAMKAPGARYNYSTRIPIVWTLP